MVGRFDEIEEVLYSRSIEKIPVALVGLIWTRINYFGLQEDFKTILNLDGTRSNIERIENKITNLNGNPEKVETFWILLAILSVFKMKYQNRDDASEGASFVFECLENGGAIVSQMYDLFMDRIDDS